MLSGVDFSHWQPSEMDVHISDYDFLIHKLTEGKSYTDPLANSRIKKFAEKKPMLVYHFLRDTAAVEREAEHFIFALKETGYMHTLGVALDYEVAHVNAAIAAKWLQIVASATGKRPVLYCGDLEEKAVYQMVRAYDYGLWIARYRKEAPDHACDFWQHTSKPFDKNIFYGDMSKLLTFIRSEVKA